MVKSKTDTQITQDSPDPGYTNEELHKQSLRDIAENKEPPKEVEEKKQEEEIPLEKVGEEIAEKTAKRLLDEQEARAKAAKEQEAEEAKRAAEAAKTPEQEYQEIRDTFEKEKGRTPTWDELAVKIEERTLEKLERKQKEALETEQKTQKAQQEEQERVNKQINAVIDDELADLYSAGKLTKIQDPKNPNDPGVVERKALFAQWQSVNTERKAKGLPEIMSATRIYEFHFKKPTIQPAGADAPVFGNRGSSVTPQDSQKINYARDIKGKRWSWFKRA